MSVIFLSCLLVARTTCPRELGFTNVYIHIGNFESSTAFCQIIGNKACLDTNNHFSGYESTDNFKRLYLLISDALNLGVKVSYEIIDWD